MSITSAAFAAVTKPNQLDAHSTHYIACYCEQQDISDSLDALFDTDRGRLDLYALDKFDEEVLELIARSIHLKYAMPRWEGLSEAFVRYGRLLLTLSAVHNETLSGTSY